MWRLQALCLLVISWLQVFVVGFTLLRPRRIPWNTDHLIDTNVHVLYCSIDGNDLPYSPYQNDPKDGRRQPLEQEGRSTSKLAALDYFLSVQNEINSEVSGRVEIISRGVTKLPKHQRIDTKVLAVKSVDETSCCIVAVTAHGQRVSTSKLKVGLELETSASIEPLIEPGETWTFCGFAVDAVPPIGHLPELNITVVVDSDLLVQCQEEDMMMLGNGGYTYWQTLISPKAILTFPNVKVVSIVSSIDDDSDPPNDQQQSTMTISPIQDPNGDSKIDSPIPFHELEPPPVNIVRLLVDRRELSNPLESNLVLVRGRIGHVVRRGKRNVHFELLPIMDDDMPCIDNPNMAPNLPWKLKNGQRLAIRVTAGRLLFQNRGSVGGELALDQIIEGSIIEALARTNVGDREALLRLANHGTLECMLADFQIFGNETSFEINGTRAVPLEKQTHSAVVSVVPQLTLSCIFDASATIEVVDSPDTVARFEETLDLFISQSGTPLVGIDCEWQPDQLSRSGSSRPVLLMQLSFHSLGKVFLLDLQVLLRPLLVHGHPMNTVETKLSSILSRLWSNPQILKVGYQVTSDLRRVAASFPHMPCFEEVHGVVELDKVIKRILHITKQKKSRSITTSMARMAQHYFGRPMDKTYQISNWETRPLSDPQKEYAALDAAVAPAIMDKAIRSANATINPQQLRVERWTGDDRLSDIAESFRFTFLIEVDDIRTLKDLDAMQIVGDNWITTESWITTIINPSP